MQRPTRMKINQRKIKRTWGRVLDNLIGVMPVAIPYLARRRRSRVGMYVLSSIGVAVMSGIGALMYLSPRTRARALTAAKDTYGKVNEKITRRREMPSTNGERVEQPTV